MRPLSLFLFFLPLLNAKPISTRNTVVLERRESIPDGFVKVGPAPADQTLTLRLGLKSGNMEGLEQRLYAISTPSNSDYGKFLSQDEIDAFVAPAQDAINAINSFLTLNGITTTSLTPAGDVLSISVPVSKANHIFDTSFDTFRHLETNTESVRTLEYSIPAPLQDILEFVHPTTTFPQFLDRLPIASVPAANLHNLTSDASSSPDAVPASCSSTITPQCLQALYGIPTTSATQTSNVLGVSGYIGSYANKADLSLFLKKFRPDLPSSTSFGLQTLDGGQNPQDVSLAGDEADLDVQYTVGVASNVPVVFLSVGSNTQDGVFGFFDLANTLLHQRSLPHVLTTSYGSDEPGISLALARKLCYAYLQLGIRGTTVLYASGDGGVAGSRPNDTCTKFVPSFPSGCPFLTSVGATRGVPEVAANLSAGGFSSLFKRPPYQVAAVESYLNKLGSTYSGRFDPVGRAYPDVSSQGENIVIAYRGKGALVAGTSASSPIFASVISLLNDELISNGKPPLGFLNPFLYSVGAKALNDITSGSNPSCGTNGFPATTGWDPVTGLGTPNYTALRRAVDLL